MTDLIHTEQFEGFNISVYALEEFVDPRGSFASGDDDSDAETIDAIARGDLTWFCAKVTASKNDIELASDYLGCCCYNSMAEFIDEAGYYGDMRATVVAMARTAIAGLSE